MWTAQVRSGVSKGWRGWQNAAGPVGAPASELKTLKTYLSANYFFVVFSLFFWNF
jgi:hypothetical protein